MIVRVIFALALICALISDRAKPLVISSHSSGRWDFHNADYPLCFTVKNAPLLKSPENTPYRVGQKYNDKGVV